MKVEKVSEKKREMQINIYPALVVNIKLDIILMGSSDLIKLHTILNISESGQPRQEVDQKCKYAL